MALKHAKVSAKADGGDSSLVLPSDWNDDHVVDTGGVTMNAATSDPSTPAADKMVFYAKKRVGRVMPSFLGPAGVENFCQPQLWGNRIIYWSPGTSTTMSSIGMTPTIAATASHPTPAMTNLGTSLDRTQFATSTTAGNGAGCRAPRNTIYGGSANTPGGFFFHARFNQGSLHTLGVQKCVGLSSSTSQLGGDASSNLADFIGMCLNAGSSNWQFARRTGSGTATLVDLGVTAAADQVFDLTMFQRPGTAEIFVRVTQYDNAGVGTVLLDTSYTTVLPALTALLGPRCEVRNGALSAAHNIALARLYVESDF